MKKEDDKLKQLFWWVFVKPKFDGDKLHSKRVGFTIDLIHDETKKEYQSDKYWRFGGELRKFDTQKAAKGYIKRFISTHEDVLEVHDV
ncbi:MAG: hypothetical protein LBV67_05655 [Streptococcaceae bacterium]|jgi:hypothetical protein|nr:hypothetical protein [Streptococcaceae bacterium]